MSKITMPCSIPSIPFDVLDLILNFVAFVHPDDKFEPTKKTTVSSLAAWRTTCRYFDSMVRPRIWQSVVLNDKTDKPCRYENLRSILDENPEIGSYVQSFAFKTIPSARNDLNLIGILPRFTKLRDFQFECIPGVFRWTDLHPDIAQGFENLCRLRTVSMIELRGVKDTPPSIITSCEHLNKLMMRDVFFDSSIDRLSHNPGAASFSLPLVKDVELWPRVASSDILAFNSLQIFNAVEKLSVSIFDKEDLQAALALLSSVKMSLRHLTVGGTYLFDKSEEGWKRQIDLEQLVKLQDIRVYCVMDTDAYIAKRLPKNVPALLDRSKPSLTVTSLHICLKIYVHGAELMLHLTDGWDELDDVVLAKYPNLQVLKLQFFSLFSSAPKEDEMLVRRHLRGVLPKIIAGGSIKVQALTDSGVTWDL